MRRRREAGCFVADRSSRDRRCTLERAVRRVGGTRVAAARAAAAERAWFDRGVAPRASGPHMRSSGTRPASSPARSDAAPTDRRDRSASLVAVDCRRTADRVPARRLRPTVPRCHASSTRSRGSKSGRDRPHARPANRAGSPRRSCRRSPRGSRPARSRTPAAAGAAAAAAPARRSAAPPRSGAEQCRPKTRSATRRQDTPRHSAPAFPNHPRPLPVEPDATSGPRRWPTPPELRRMVGT